MIDKPIKKTKPQNLSFLNSASYDIILVITLFTAFAIRLPYLFIERLSSDEALYAWCAKRISADPFLIFSKEIIEFHPPLFPILLSVCRFSLPPELTYRILALALSLLGIILIYRIGVNISSKFLGLFCALMLTFNYTYLLNGTFIMVDIPTFVLCTWLLLLLGKVNETTSLKQHMALGIIVSLLILLKWPGVIFVPLVFLSYLFLFNKIDFSNKFKKMFIPLLIPIITTVLLIANNVIQQKTIFPTDLISALLEQHPETPPAWYYIVNVHNILTFPFLVPLFLYGFYGLFHINPRYRALLILFLIIPLIAISITKVKEIRYSLIILPSILVITGIGIETLLNQIFKKPQLLRISKFLIVFIFFTLSWNYYPRIQTYLTKSLATFTGYAEAGQWIKRHLSSQDIIAAQNIRSIRYYSDVNYKKYGGQMVLLPKEKKDFEMLAQSKQSPMFVVVDIWSESIPSEFHCFTNTESDEIYFRQLGFVLVKEIYRSVYEIRRNICNTLPVIRIFERQNNGKTKKFCSQK